MDGSGGELVRAKRERLGLIKKLAAENIEVSEPVERSETA